MADIDATVNTMNTTEVAAGAPVSQALVSKISANLNAHAESFKVYAPVSATLPKNGTSVVLSFSVVMRANDALRFEFGGGQTFDNAGINISAGHTIGLSLKRSGVTVASKSYAGNILGPERFIKGSHVDKPGAGTHLYTVEIAVSGFDFDFSFGVAGDYMMLEVLRSE